MPQYFGPCSGRARSSVGTRKSTSSLRAAGPGKTWSRWRETSKARWCSRSISAWPASATPSAGAGAGIDQHRLWQGRHSQARRDRPDLRHRGRQRRPSSHGRPLGRLAGLALAAAVRRLHASRPLQQARPPRRQCRAHLRCRAWIRADHPGYPAKPAGYSAIAGGEPAREVAKHLDFFTISECRDMLFHAQEHQMTLPEIANFVRENDIEFLGFVADPGITRQFRTRFPQPERRKRSRPMAGLRDRKSGRVCRDVSVLDPQERIAPGGIHCRCQAICQLHQALDPMRMLHSCGAAKFLLQCSMNSYFLD